MNSTESTVESPACPKLGRPRKVDDEAISAAADLIRDGRSLRSVAREKGIPVSTLSFRLGLKSAPGRKQALSADAKQQAGVMRAAGMSVDNIAANLGVSPATVRRALASIVNPAEIA